MFDLLRICPCPLGLVLQNFLGSIANENVV